MKAEGLVWSDYYQNYVTPADQKTGQHAQAKLRAWEVRVQALECQGLTRSDAQAVVDAEDTKTAGEQLALIVETIREVQS